MSDFDFKKTESKILKFWEQNQIFKKSLEQRRSGNRRAKSFVFFEGPPTANGLPHIGHFLTRIYKDLYGRYKTMRGFFVLRRAGWDTHGLPVEIEVEKQLGFTNKKDIEKYGIAKFNRKARESVWKYKAEWEKMTERMGFWLDLAKPYITYEPNYIESVWWLIKKIADKKLLYRGYKVLPYCPRCGTALSSHEVAQGYKDITETSVYAKFKVKNSHSLFSLSNSIYLLAWTTTPWTLPGNVALAVGEKISYVIFREKNQKNDDYFIVAKERLESLIGEYEIVKEFKGKALVGLEYEPLFDVAILKSKTAYKVYPADFVTTSDGTGIVHTAVMYGEEDYKLGQVFDLPTHHTVNERGEFTADVKEFVGQNVKNAEKGIIEYLEKNNLLFKKDPHLHTYPFCWRCNTALIYYAKDSWFIRMSALRAKLVKNNNQINWLPAHIKNGRFGEFIGEAKDWAFSRERYWGTPLPVWICKDCGQVKVIGSLDELDKNRYRPKNTYYLLRHGQSTKSIIAKDGIIASRLEHDKYGLTPKGEEEIKKVARELKKQGGVDLILSSPFLRTKNSANIISEYLGIEVKIDKRLKELDHGSLCEAQSHALCLVPGADVNFDVKRGDGESWRDVKNRVASLIGDLEKKYEDKRILLTTHGDPIWLIKGLAENLSEEKLIETHEKNYPKEGTLTKVEFENVPRNEEGNLDLHRPYVDEIILRCSQCTKKNADHNTGQMKRVPELIDVWFDSGAMPYAQWHYPFENKKMIDGGMATAKLGKAQQFPADFIVEAIDQTRGWFYTLLAIATAIGKKEPYKNVIVLGHVLDTNGQKMSKSKGNVVTPDEVIAQVGADAARWYFFTVSDAGDAKPFSMKDAEIRLRSFIGTIQNVLRFLEIYSAAVVPSGSPEPKNLFDTWFVLRLNNLINEVTHSLDKYDPTSAGRKIEDFVINDLSNWWLRRSRKRFQKPSSNEELIYVTSFLRFVLLQLAKILAPFTPFLAEDIHLKLHKQQKPGTISIHLHDWPQPERSEAHQTSFGGKNLEEIMTEVRSFVTLGLAARKNKQLKVRQPLAVVTLKRKEKFDPSIEELIRDEINVKKVDYNSEQTEEIILDENLTEELIREGFAREIVRQIQDMRKDAKYRLDEKIFGAWESDSSDVQAVVKKFGREIESDTLLKEFMSGHRADQKYNIEKDFKLAPNIKIWLGLRK